MRRWLNVALGVLGLLIVSPLFAPQVLAFPHRTQVAGATVWSENPQDRVSLAKVLSRSQELVSASPIAPDRVERKIFLTDGGWRWQWLALQSRGGFALTRAFTDPVIIVNRSDAGSDRVWNGAALGGERSLSGVIAHETIHGVLRDRYGALAMALKPQWLVEGYCDHVAQESSLTAADVRRLEHRGEDHPALPYYRGREKVARELAARGGSVDALFASGSEVP